MGSPASWGGGTLKGGSYLGPARSSSMPLCSGALEGGFHFDLSDGAHTSPGHFFRVVAQKQAVLSLEGTRKLTVCPGRSACWLAEAEWRMVARNPCLGSCRKLTSSFMLRRVCAAAQQPEPERQFQRRR